LRDLGTGVEINKAIESHTAPMSDLEKDFSAFVRQRAEQLAPGLDWEKPKLEDLISVNANEALLSANPDVGETNSAHSIPKTGTGQSPKDPGGLVGWAKAHPTNYFALIEQAKSLVARKQYEAAKPLLQQLVELYPSQTGPESAYAMLAAANRGLGDTNAERQVLLRLAQEDDEANEAYLRLAELASATKDWPVVVQNVQRSLAVNPLAAIPYRFLAQASRQTGNNSQAIRANTALLQLDPPNPAEVHFELAQALHRAGDPAARRQVLEALEEAPRYQAALRLLVEIHDSDLHSTPAETPSVKATQ
jgi:tetratricopeptide (TPR) repeat protein